METVKDIVIYFIGIIIGFSLCYSSLVSKHKAREQQCIEAIDSIMIDLDKWIEYFENIPSEPIDTTFIISI
jgi:hypothetical protein